METIIPEFLKELKDSYESINSLSSKERRLLCNSIVDYFVSREIKFSLDTMDELAEQIVEHFPTEDKVFSKNKEILKGYAFFKYLFSNSLRNPGAIVVAEHTVGFFFVFITHVETWPNKPSTHPLQLIHLTSVRMKMMKKSNL